MQLIKKLNLGVYFSSPVIFFTMQFFLKLNLGWTSFCSKWWTSYFDIHGTLTKSSLVLLFDYNPSESNFRLLMVSPTLQLTAVHLVDAHLCSDPGKYISALMLSLSTMIHLELPHINVLSKIDLIENYGTLGQINFMIFKAHNFTLLEPILKFLHYHVWANHLLVLQRSTLTFTLMYKIYLIYSIILIKILDLLSIGMGFWHLNLLMNFY